MKNVNIDFITDFSKSRSKKIGASEIAACIPHPEKNGSIAGYDETAFTIWEYKTEKKERTVPGIYAKLGNKLEPTIIELFLDENYPEYSKDFYKGFLLCELEKNNDGFPNAISYQNTPFLHHTKSETDFAVSHCDCIDPNAGIIIEAKSRSGWMSKRKDDKYSGYDLELKSNHGIPLKDFFQLQFQAAIYNYQYGIKFEKLYLAVLFDRNPFHFWEIKPDIKIQERLLEIADYMKKCIDTDTPPKTLAMNQKDIKLMYPKINEDYRILSDEENEKAFELAKLQRHSFQQEKIWKEKKQEANDSLSILLKDTKTIKGILDNEIIEIATWTEKKGSEGIAKPEADETNDSLINYLKKNDKNTYNYLQRKNYIRESKCSKYVTVKYKGE